MAARPAGALVLPPSSSPDADRKKRFVEAQHPGKYRVSNGCRGRIVGTTAATRTHWYTTEDIQTTGDAPWVARLASLTPKLAPSAVERQSATVEQDLHTVEVLGSSSPLQWTMHMVVGNAPDG